MLFLVDQQFHQAVVEEQAHPVVLVLMDHKVLHQVGTARHWVGAQQSLQLVAVTVLMATIMAVMVALVVAEELVREQAQQAKETTPALLPTMCHSVVVVAREQ